MEILKNVISKILIETNEKTIEKLIKQKNKLFQFSVSKCINILQENNIQIKSIKNIGKYYQFYTINNNEFFTLTFSKIYSKTKSIEYPEILTDINIVIHYHSKKLEEFKVMNISLDEKIISKLIIETVNS